MKIAKEIADVIVDLAKSSVFPAAFSRPEDHELLTEFIAAKLGSVEVALRGLFDATEVDDYNYIAYDMAEKALTMLSEEE